MQLVFDTESNGLLVEATKLFCICAVDIDSGERWSFDKDEIEAGLALLSSADCIIGHNVYMHDLPLIKKLYPSWAYNRAEDTFIMSALYSPDRPNGHSVEAYASITGIEKVQHEDWSQWSEEMQYRCEQDVEGNVLIYQHLKSKMKEDWNRALELEYAVARVQAQQTLNGVVFDLKAARKLYKEIDTRIKAIEEEANRELPERYVQHGVSVSKPFKKDGTYSKMTEDWYGESLNSLEVVGQFTRIDSEKLNINSDMQVKELFLSQGWVPTQWNYKRDKDTGFILKDKDKQPIKSSPKLTEDSFSSIHTHLPKLLAERSVLVHRRGLIYNERADGELTGWVNKLRPDGRISAEAIPQATNTGRYRHKVVVNVPKAKDSVLYGKQLRALFIAKEGHTLVGTDAVALENRIEGHYTAYYDGGKYAQTLLTGDPHTANANAFSRALGIEVDRDLAKRIKYAITYGAQPQKVAETAGVSLKAGKELYDAFWKNNPSLYQLYEAVQKTFEKKGYLTGIDGRLIRIRNSHSALNALFQCAGSLVVKKATAILFEQYVPDNNLDAKLVLHMHDEFQAEVGNYDVEEYVRYSLRCFKEAGEFFNLNIPIEGDSKSGRNWSLTH